MSEPTVTAIVPHWNRGDLLQTLLDSIREQTQPFNEIIVSDNGSTDDSVEIAERAGARVLRLGSNLGFAAAVNRGIEAARTEWVAILNNDVTLAPDWLSKVMEGVRRQSACFATGKILRSTDSSVIDATYDEISRGACALRCGSGKPDAPVWNQERRIRFAPMTAAIFHRDLFRELGGLDESFGSYLEDVEFGLRCALAGKEGAYVPSAVARHLGSATFGEWKRETAWLIARNQVLIAAKHFRGQPLLPILVGQLLWGLVALRHGCGLAFLQGKRAGFRAAAGLGKPKNESNDTAKRLEIILQASEGQILQQEKQGGFDRYWRAYFWLLRR